MAKKNFAEKQFEERAAFGVTHHQHYTQHRMILEIMELGWKTEKKVWWFAYELMGFWVLEKGKVFMSYKASTRVSELANVGLVESRKSNGKLHLYASKSVLARFEK